MNDPLAITVSLDQLDEKPTRVNSVNFMGQPLHFIKSTAQQAETGYVVTYHFEIRPPEITCD